MPVGYLAFETIIISLENYRSIAPQTEFTSGIPITNCDNVMPILSEFAFSRDNSSICLDANHAYITYSYDIPPIITVWFITAILTLRIQTINRSVCFYAEAVIKQPLRALDSLASLCSFSSRAFFHSCACSALIAPN